MFERRPALLFRGIRSRNITSGRKVIGASGKRVLNHTYLLSVVLSLIKARKVNREGQHTPGDILFLSGSHRNNERLMARKDKALSQWKRAEK